MRERQGNLAADQTAACIANVHTAKTGHGMLGRAAQLGLYCSEGVISATGPCSVKSSVKQLLTLVSCAHKKHEDWSDDTVAAAA